MKLDLSGIRFLFISPDVAFLREQKNELTCHYKAEVLLGKNFSDANSILEAENPHVTICYFTSAQESWSFARLFQKTNPAGLLYFYGKENFKKQDLADSQWEPHKEQIKFLPEPVEWDKVFTEIHEKLSSRFTSLKNLSPAINQLQYYLLFRSEKMQRGLEFLPQMALTDYSLLITGESGTGKEMVARAVHSLSKRKEKPFVAVNCGAIPENLAESELFGYEKGAFTGANSTKKGKFELANRGTLLLDEIGDMPLHLQTKLLRILEDGQVFRVGSEKGFGVDVRVLAATNVHLQQKIEEKLFRSDLFYRLNILQIRIPPLRERKDDIGLLAWHFLQRVLSEIGFQAPYPYLTDDAIIELQAYPWYGNVRELRNFITQLAVLLPPRTRKIDGEKMKTTLSEFSSYFQNLSDNFTKAPPQDFFQIPLNKKLEEVKNLYIEKVLKLCNNNKTKAAKSLGISLRSLRQKQNEN
jgi:transcriptional regulator with PAS, ATPase and Fis domain